MLLELTENELVNDLGIKNKIHRDRILAVRSCVIGQDIPHSCVNFHQAIDAIKTSDDISTDESDNEPETNGQDDDEESEDDDEEELEEEKKMNILSRSSSSITTGYSIDKLYMAITSIVLFYCCSKFSRLDKKFIIYKEAVIAK